LIGGGGKRTKIYVVERFGADQGTRSVLLLLLHRCGEPGEKNARRETQKKEMYGEEQDEGRGGEKKKEELSMTTVLPGLRSRVSTHVFFYEAN